MAAKEPFTPEERQSLIVEIAKRHRLRPEDAARFVDSDRPSKRNPLLERQWVSLLHRMVMAMSAGTAKPEGLFQSVFWVRLYGALTEIPERFEKLAGLHEGQPKSWKHYARFKAVSEIYAACRALRGSLSEDELVFAAFSRHVHAHVYQDGFEYAIEPGNPKEKQRGAVRTKQKDPAVGRHLSVDAVHEVVDRICIEHGNDESRIASHFVAKVKSAVEQLEAAMEAYEIARGARAAV